VPLAANGKRLGLLEDVSAHGDHGSREDRHFALRSCVLATRLAELAGLGENERRNVYHQALLRYVGCNAYTHLLASAFGDETAMRRDLARGRQVIWRLVCSRNQ
jgi:hypothetical protein